MRKLARDILPSPTINIAPLEGFALDEEGAKKVELFKQKLIDKAILDELEKKKMLEAYAARKDMRDASDAMKRMVENLKAMPERVAEAGTQIEALRQQYLEATSPSTNADWVRNCTPIDAVEFLRSLRVLKNSTDETIEMAPGVHAHTVNLVIAMIEGRA